MQQNKINCPSCDLALMKPKYPFTRCPKCSYVFMNFCHNFPKLEFTPMKCQVPDCKSQIFFFFCPRCKTLVSYPRFRMGSKTQCPKCKVEVCYLKCTCGKVRHYQAGRNYQGEAWKCKNCPRPVQFVTCDNCLRPRYSQNGAADEFVCGQKQIQWQLEMDAEIPIKNRTKGCGQTMKKKFCKECKVIFYCNKKSQIEFCLPCYHHQLANQSKKEKIDIQQSNFLNTCKICMQRQSCLINLTCFHLCLCLECKNLMDERCPICRQVGRYQKVYKE